MTNARNGGSLFGAWNLERKKWRWQIEIWRGERTAQRKISRATEHVNKNYLQNKVLKVVLFWLKLLNEEGYAEQRLHIHFQRKNTTAK
jgi:hypothetical protein